MGSPPLAIVKPNPQPTPLPWAINLIAPLGQLFSKAGGGFRKELQLVRRRHRGACHAVLVPPFVSLQGGF